jgi:hypothetical protein
MGKRDGKVGASAGSAGRVGPVEAAPSGEQLMASVAGGMRSTAGGRYRDAAGIVPEERGAERDVLGPVEEVVGLSFIEYSNHPRVSTMLG